VAAVVTLAAVVDIPAIRSAAREVEAARFASSSVAAASADVTARSGVLEEARKGEGEADRATAALLAAAREAADRDPQAAGRRFLAEYPEARAMLIEAGMSGTIQANGSFYRLAGFTPAQIDRFQRLLVETWVDHLSVGPGGFGTSGMPSNDALKAVAGDEAFQRFKAYSQMIDAYRWTGVAARELNLGGAPLSPEQADQVAQILANSSSIYRSGRALNGASVEGGAAVASVDWDTAVAQARAVLSASQWKAAEPVFLNFQFEGALNRARVGQNPSGDSE
jgi:hypothetical protein